MQLDGHLAARGVLRIKTCRVHQLSGCLNSFWSLRKCVIHLLIAVQGTAGKNAGPQICNLLISSVVKKGVGAGAKGEYGEDNGNYLEDAAPEKLIWASNEDTGASFKTKLSTTHSRLCSALTRY